ncbi:MULTISPECIES: HlyD family type I secretion periplasmic adaptor subunit [unclassified Sulfitobacter]|jgi:HlyD family secretion protein|uniref:HlyD family type I secretion periplasmic adaptor subunit n=1 Tax=unclassified Sulfitobacter TaxID=196795 RepID=UPI00159312A1|nr:HlyD family type I secretion periplasmic adaptor subunit [Sulfitobacter sp. HGT1]
MRHAPTAIIDATWYDDVPRSIRGHVIFGTFLIISAFGGFGYWATQAPLAAAVVSQGSFIATGRNKIVQHLEGGIIEQIYVAEGDMVEAGQVLVRLDETSALGKERELFLRQVRLEVAQARFNSEYKQENTLRFPPHLEKLRADLEVATMMENQSLGFTVSMQGLKNDIGLLERSIEALGIRSSGYQSQLEATQIQVAILAEELADKQTLLDRGLVRRTDVNTVRRAIAEAEGQVGRLTAEINEISEVRDRYTAQIEQTLGEHRDKALDELQVVEAELDGIREQVRTAQEVLNRVDITAPVSGTIVRLYYHTAGGVVESGKAIVEILPSAEPLIIEAQVPRTNIDSVKIGLHATIRLSALNQRTTPVLEGKVFYVSADTITDQNSTAQQEVYLTRISIEPEELLRVPGFSPTPGMPAEIMIQTDERTFVQYLMKPILDSMSRAFRER